MLLHDRARSSGPPDDLADRLAEAVRDGLAVYDEAGQLVDWNAAARTITGWSREAAARKVTSAIPEGLSEIREGKWIDVRRFEFRRDGKRLTAMVFTDVTAQLELREANRRLEALGLTDAATRLPRKAIAMDHLRRALALAERDQRSVAVLALRVAPGGDSPKLADPLLREIARRLAANVRASDLVARSTDDEFLMVLTAIAGVDDGRVVAVRLLLALAQPAVVDGQERSVGCVVGVSAYPRDGETAEILEAAASAAMRRALAAGGGYRSAPDPA